MTALPLALLHGFTGSPRSFDPVLALLGPRDVFAPPLAGHGHPASSVRGFEDEVDRIAALLRARAPVWALGGYSLGGRVGMGLLCRHPGLVASAVLIGAQPGLEAEDERSSRAEADERLRGVLEQQGISAFVDLWENVPLFASQRSLPEETRDRQRRARLERDPGELSRSLGSLGLAAMPSYWSALPGVRAKVDLVVGEHDAKFLAIAGRMRERLPRAELHVVPGVGHNVVLEAPEVVAELLARSLGEAP